VILQVLADAGEVNDLADRGGVESRTPANARQFEEAWALNGAGGNHHLLAGLDDGAVLEGDSGGDLRLFGPVFLEVDLGHPRACQDTEVRARGGDVSIGGVGSVVDGRIDVAWLVHDAERVAPERLEIEGHTEAVQSWDPGVLLRGDDTVDDRLDGPAGAHAGRPVVGGWRECLDLLHSSDHGRPAPARVTEVGPGIVLGSARPVP